MSVDKMSLIEELQNPPRLSRGRLDEGRVIDLMRIAASALSTMIGVAAKASRQAASQGSAGGESGHWQARPPHSDWRMIAPEHVDDYRAKDWEVRRSPDLAQAPNEPVAFINRRLEDLAEANSLYGKDQRLNTPYKIARNNREISWLKDLRSLILIASSVPSAKSPVMQAAENASKIIEGWSNSKKEYADQATRGSEVPSAHRGGDQ